MIGQISDKQLNITTEEYRAAKDAIVEGDITEALSPNEVEAIRYDLNHSAHHPNDRWYIGRLIATIIKAGKP